MTVNNLALNESCFKIRAAAGRLEELMREGRIHALGDALATIECEAREGGYLVNDLMRPTNELASRG